MPPYYFEVKSRRHQKKIDKRMLGRVRCPYGSISDDYYKKCILLPDMLWLMGSLGFNMRSNDCKWSPEGVVMYPGYKRYFIRFEQGRRRHGDRSVLMGIKVEWRFEEREERNECWEEIRFILRGWFLVVLKELELGPGHEREVMEYLWDR